MDYAWFILGNGRKGYLERTIATWEANLLDPPSTRLIFDDSGNAQYRDWLTNTYGDRFTIIPIDEAPAGHVAAIKTIWSTLRNLEVDYFLGIEEDWALFRPIAIQPITGILDAYPDILQMRIPRTIWHSEYHKLDLMAGSLLAHHLKDPGAEIVEHNGRFYQIRARFYFWSHNPSIFGRQVLHVEYPETKSHEYDYGVKLLDTFPNGRVGFYALNQYDAYITHIGYRDPRLLKSLPSLSG